MGTSDGRPETTAGLPTLLLGRPPDLPRPPADAPPPAAGWAVGRFRVERELGRGGMGVVLLARDSDLNRPVAVKLLRDDRPEVLARFRLEAHALAGLAHPNAVRVYEFGEHAGRPYLALEYVDGPSLHDALRAGPLDPGRAAGLLAQVADAVQAAHALGVVHRDLKPANVLLDAADVPKLTDFGIARRLEDGAGLTDTNVAVGTPGYMAPEQAAGRPPDARTDVYGLGATLYECLTGRPPFVGPTAAVLHQLMTADPVSPRRLNAAVPADLETVCLTCLHKDPGRRYRTAADLAADLGRVARGEPVRARPAGPVERAVRWGRRNKLPAALAAAAVLSLAGGAAAAGWQALRATAARDAQAAQRERAEGLAAAADGERAAAVAARQEAEERRDEAAAINAFLLDDLIGQASGRGQADAGFGTDPALTVRTAVDRAAARAGGRFRDRPATAEAVRLALGKAYQGLDASARAVEQFRLVADSRRGRLGPGHPDTLTAVHYQAHNLTALGRPAEARPLAEECLRGRRAALGPGHPDTLLALSTLADLYAAEGRPAEAVPLYEECVRRYPAAAGAGHPNGHRLQVRLGQAYDRAGRPADALAAYEAGVGGLRGGPDHPDTANCIAVLALARERAGRAAEAVALFEEVVRMRRATQGPSHPDTLWGVSTLGRLLYKAGRPADAVPVLADGLRLRQAELGPAHPDTLVMAMNLAQARIASGREADAAPLFERVWRARSAADPGDRSAAVARANLGVCLYRLGRYAEAEPHLLAMHAGYAASPATTAGDLDKSRRRLADLYDRLGRPAEAARWRPEVAPAPRPVG